MDHALVVFSSVTTSNRAKKLAKKVVDYAAVVQLPPGLGIRGCSYCLRIQLHDYNTIMKIASEYGLAVKAAFRERDVGGQKVYEQI